MNRVVLGVDSSTQSTKVEARLVETGDLIDSASAPHPATLPPVSEQDPRAWWDALVQALQRLAGSVRADVVALSVAAQQHGLVLLDRRDEPVRPAKLWNDTTSAAQAETLVAQLGPGSWAKLVGSVPVAAFTITKLLWTVENCPDALSRTAKVMLPHDYLTYRLCGAHVTDRADASGTGWFSPFEGSHGAYRKDLIELAGVEPDQFVAKLPEVLAPTEPAGEISAAAAAELGLPRTTLVAAGTGDNMAGALGLGLNTGDLVISLGTSGVVYARSETPTLDASGSVAGFADAAGGYLPLVCTLNATKVTDAVARWVGTDGPSLVT